MNHLNNILKKQFKNHEKEWVDFFITNHIEWLIEKESVKKAALLLQCYAFIFYKIKILGIEELLNDFKIVIRNNEIGKSLASIQEIQSVLEQSAHLFQNKTNSIPTILYGYFDEAFSENIKSLKEQIIEDTKEVWLKSKFVNLANQQNALIKTVPVNNNQTITSLDISDDKKRLYIGIKGEIQIRNTKNYQLVTTLYVQNHKASIRKIYDLKDNYILVKSDNENNTLLEVWSFKENLVLAKTEYVFENSKLSIDESHKLEISPDKKWILSRGFEKGYSLVIRNSTDLKVVYKKVFKNPITDFKFTTIKHLINWRESKWRQEITHKQAILYALEKDNGDTDLNLSLITKKGAFKKKYKTQATGFYFDGKILIKEEKEHFYFLSRDNTVEKYKFQNLELLGSISILPKDSKESLENTIVLPKKNELLTFSNKGKAYHWNEDKRQVVKIEETYDYIEVLDIASNEYHAISDGIFKTKLFNLYNTKLVTEVYNNSVHNTFKHLQETLFVSIDDAHLHIWDISKNKKQIEFNSYGSVNSIYKLNNYTWLTGSSEGFIYGFKKLNDNYDCFLKVDVQEHINDINTFYHENICYLIVSCGDFVFDKNKVKIINLETQETISTFEGHTALVQKSERIPSSNYIISISYDYTFRVWDYRNGTVFRTCSHTLDENFTGMSIGFEILNNYLVTFSQEAIIISDTINFDVIFEFPRHQVSIESYSLSDCKTFFATGYMNGDIKIWSLSERKELFEFPNKSNALHKLYWKKVKNEKPRIDSYILSSDDTYLFLWDFSNKTLIRKFEASKINDIAFFDGNEKFVSASSLGEVIIWDIYKEKELFKCNIGRAIMKIEIDEKERIIILGEHNGQIQFLKIQNEPK